MRQYGQAATWSRWVPVSTPTARVAGLMSAPQAVSLSARPAARMFNAALRPRSMTTPHTEHVLLIGNHDNVRGSRRCPLRRWSTGIGSLAEHAPRWARRGTCDVDHSYIDDGHGISALPPVLAPVNG